MQNITITPVTDDAQVRALCALADRIWHEHFTPIIGADQVDYMLDKFQSYPAVTGQLQKEGYQYYFLRWQDEIAGYMGIRPDGDDLFLSKLYVEKSFRGRKIASAASAYLANRCRRDGLRRIWLTVNRFNADTIAAYRALGFTEVREQKTDIGNGFVMDDYVMERVIN